MGAGLGYSQSNSSSKSSPTNAAPYYDQALGASYLTPYLANLVNTTNAGYGTSAAPQYGGPLVAPMTAGQSAAVGSGTNFYNSIASGNSINNPMLNSYIQSAVLPIEQQYQQSQAANEGAFTQAGQQVQSSSPYAYASALANRGAMQAIGSTAAGIAYPAYQLASQQQYQAPLNALQIASVPQQISEQGVQAGLANYQQQLNYINSMIQMTGGLSYKPGQVSSSSSSSYGGSASVQA